MVVFAWINLELALIIRYSTRLINDLYQEIRTKIFEARVAEIKNILFYFEVYKILLIKLIHL